MMFFSKAATFGDEDSLGTISLSPSDVPVRNAEAQFVALLKSADAEAFELLVDRYSQAIYGLALRLSNDAEEAADITQDTFIRAFRSIGTFRGDSSLKTWLFRIAINESRNRFRWWKRRRRDKTESLEERLGDSEIRLGDTLIDQAPTPESDAERAERESALLAALASLKPAFREAVILADIHGLTYEECAAALATNIGTVKSRIARGREQLRKRLKGL
jgi:RNA polymerase sigma-70 factor (ECF subfamily)